MNTIRVATRGLPTLALLKAHYDKAQDHIGMFEPFLADTVATFPRSDFTLAEIRDALAERHGLSVPSHTLEILLGRIKKRGMVRREAGRYFRSETDWTVPDIAHARQDLETQHAMLALEFMTFASDRAVIFTDKEEALLTILAFISENQMPMLLDRSEELIAGPAIALETRRRQLTARFIQDECLARADRARIVQDLLEGFVLQNALLLKDISTAGRRFQDLTVYFDTGFLLGALGLEGEARELAAREGINLLRDTGARLAVFEKTLEEIRGILHVHERAFGSSTERRRLSPTDLTRFFLTNRYEPSDIKQVDALLERNIRSLGLRIEPFPDRRDEFVLHENALTQALMRPDSSPLEPRVVHDVDCVSAILTLRAGFRAESLDRAKAVFATTSGAVVKTIIDWFRQEEERGVPPIIHQLALSSIAWLKKPASAATLKLHELVALCVAALKPSPQLWADFLRHLEKLEKDGTLSSEETVAIVATELTDVLLLEVEVARGDIDAKTLTEVVDRVKAEYQAEARSELLEFTARAGADAERNRQMRLSVERRLNSVAAVVATMVFVLVYAVFVIALIVLLPGVLEAVPWQLAAVGWVAIAVSTLATLRSFIYGGSLASWRKTVESTIYRRARTWLAPQLAD
jgi:hypothetical protein